MKAKHFIIPLLVLLSLLQISSFGQTEMGKEQLLNEIMVLKQRQKELRSSNRTIQNQLNKVQGTASTNLKTIDSLKQEIAKINEELVSTDNRLSDKIIDTNNDLTQTKGDFNKSIKSGWIYFCIGFFALAILTLILFFISRRNQSKDSAMIDMIRKTQNKLQEESIKLDQRMLEYFEKQPLRQDDEADHSLATKVADEVIRIEMNLAKMDKNIRGYKQLSKAVERIKNNYSAQGYDLVDMLGMTYDEGMRINADFVVDESLPEGSRIITSITKPQINYHGKMIQKAIVTVSQNI